MDSNVQIILDKLAPIYDSINEVLNAWNGEGNLQFPTLLGMVAVKLNWTEKQCRELEPQIRFFVREHPDWYVTRGAHGGIMRSSEKQKKEEAKAAKEAAKAKMKAAIDAKAAEVAQAAAPAELESDDIVSE